MISTITGVPGCSVTQDAAFHCNVYTPDQLDIVWKYPVTSCPKANFLESRFFWSKDQMRRIWVLVDPRLFVAIVTVSFWKYFFWFYLFKETTLCTFCYLKVKVLKHNIGNYLFQLCSICPGCWPFPSFTITIIEKPREPRK